MTVQIKPKKSLFGSQLRDALSPKLVLVPVMLVVLMV